MVYITRGQGFFETKVQRRQNIKAGDVFFLFPGVWHRYALDPKTGWDEQWIGVNGPLSERFMRFEDSIDFNRLAGSLGLGYTTFRRRFKQQIGIWLFVRICG